MICGEKNNVRASFYYISSLTREVWVRGIDLLVFQLKYVKLYITQFTQVRTRTQFELFIRGQTEASLCFAVIPHCSVNAVGPEACRLWPSDLSGLACRMLFHFAAARLIASEPCRSRPQLASLHLDLYLWRYYQPTQDRPKTSPAQPRCRFRWLDFCASGGDC